VLSVSYEAIPCGPIPFGDIEMVENGIEQIELNLSDIDRIWHLFSERLR
jgi:hypothetical protein